MPQWLVGCPGIEIARFRQQLEVLEKQRAGADMAEQLPLLVRQQHQPAKRRAADQHEQQRREDAARPPHVEVLQREAAAVQPLAEVTADQKAGDHEEDVHATEATTQAPGVGVKSQYGEHGHCAQAVDVGAVGQS